MKSVSLKKLNKEEPPPKGYKHPAYEVTGSNGCYHVAYLYDGQWVMPIREFKSERQAFCYILDKLYYGPQYNERPI